jgi:NhaP-type Na+/H+ or K+/H+ antiporter
MHLKNISKIIPAVVVFSLPGGSFLLPVLAEALDRRKTRRLVK